MADPKFTDGQRFSMPYVPVAEQGDGYLRRRFQEIREKQKAEAAAHLRNVIQRKFTKEKS